MVLKMEEKTTSNSSEGEKKCVLREQSTQKIVKLLYESICAISYVQLLDFKFLVKAKGCSEAEHVSILIFTLSASPHFYRL